MNNFSTEMFQSTPAKISTPAGDPVAAVVVLHPAHGLTPQIDDWLQRLSDEGFLAVALQLHHRRGCAAIDPVAEFGGDMTAFAAALPSDDDFREDFRHALDGLSNRGFNSDQVSVLGFSYGGRAAYLAASEFPIASAVSWYPVGIHRKNFVGNDGLPALPISPDSPAAPWLCLSGDRDFLLQPDEISEWEQTLSSSGNPRVTLVRYPDAGHSFDVHAAFGPEAPDSYHEESTEDAWRRTREHLFSRHGVRA